MTATDSSDLAGEREGRGVRRAAVVLAASVVLGGLTSVAQGVLPDELSSFANSASGWTILTALLVFWSRLRPPQAAVVAAMSFVLLVIGYAVASELRGLSYNPTRWALVGVVAGPFIGTASAWLRARGVRASLGTAALAGVGIGEATYGLTVVRDTTSPVYWSLVGVLGVVLLVVMLARVIRGPLPVATAVAGTVVASGLFLAGYRLL